jgi:hypothetical protein
MGVFMSTYIVLSVVSVVSNGGVTWLVSRPAQVAGTLLIVSRSMLMRITPVSAAKLHYTLLRTVMRSVPQASRDPVD